MGSRSSRDALLRVLEPVVVSAGFDLEDLDVTPAGRRRVLRVVVDRDGGVDLDDIADVSRAVSTALDDSDAMGGTPYVLEVTSPGVDRPLTERRHWRRARGRLVLATLAEGAPVTGRVLDVDEAGVTVDVDGTARVLPWESLRRGVVQVEFSRPDDNGGTVDTVETVGTGDEDIDVDCEGDGEPDEADDTHSPEDDEEGPRWTST